MKKITSISLLFPLIIFSQGYTFDYKCSDFETQLKGDYKGNTRTNYIYLNTKDSTMIAYDYKFSNADNSLWIFDFKNELFLSFNRSKSMDNSKLELVNFLKIKKYKDERKIERVEVEKQGSIYKISTFETMRKKRPNLILEIELVESEFPLPRIRFMDLTMNIHHKIYDTLLEKLPSKFYRIKTVKTNYRNGVIMFDDYSNCKKEETFFDLTKYLKSN